MIRCKNCKFFSDFKRADEPFEYFECNRIQDVSCIGPNCDEKPTVKDLAVIGNDYGSHCFRMWVTTEFGCALGEVK